MRNNECKICKITNRMHEALHGEQIKNNLCKPCAAKPVDVNAMRQNWLSDLAAAKANQLTQDRRAFFGA